MEKLAVSVAEASEMLGLSRPTVYQLIHQGAFPSFQVGRRTLISTAGLQEWIDRQTKSQKEV